MSRFPSPSSSTSIVPPFLLDNRMNGKGFIEPHRNNLPRRKRKVVTTAEHGAAIALEIDTAVLPPPSEAGPRSSFQESNDSQIHPSSSVDTNITEPPSSLPTPSTLHNSPTFSNSPTIFLTHSAFQTSKPSFFHGYHLDNALPPSKTPSKGYIQPTSATLPRRHRLSVAQEDRRRKSLAEHQRKSICAQELSKGIILGFLAEGDEHDENIVRIKVYDDSTTPSRTSSTSPILSSELHLQLTLPTDSSSYIDGTTSLTDSQIKQACTFIDEHISIPLADTSSINSTLRPGHVSVVILTPCIRPEEAMSIGISYLAGMEDMGKGVHEINEDKKNDDDVDNLNDYTYSTVHRLLMAFHDDPILNSGLKPELEAPLGNLTCEEPTAFTLYDPGCGGSLKGLRPEWRGVLSFDGMQRLDRVWTCTRSL